MSSENDVADRLLAEARKKTAKQESPKLGKISLIVGIIALIVSPISILGWVLGLAAVGTGVTAVRRPASTKQPKIAIVLGVLAILVGVFFFTKSLKAAITLSGSCFGTSRMLTFAVALAGMTVFAPAAVKPPAMPWTSSVGRDQMRSSTV